MVSDTGQLLVGETAFRFWCNKKNHPFEKTIREFIKTVLKSKQYKNTF